MADNEHKWAWFAGLFEGEGSIVFLGANSVRLALSSTDEDVVDRCLEVTGVGKVGVQREAVGNQKKLWIWSVVKRDHVLSVLDQIEEYLCGRRSERSQAARTRLAGMRRTGHCNKGHKMSGENLYVSPKGQRHCRACRSGRV